MGQNLLNRITKKPDICHGKPTIRGLRYPVDSMLDLLASDMSIDEILVDYPDLEREDLLACLEYAAQLSRTKKSTLKKKTIGSISRDAMNSQRASFRIEGINISKKKAEQIRREVVKEFQNGSAT